MITVQPTTLTGNGVRLEPLSLEHADGLGQAAADGELWSLFYTSVPSPGEVPEYIETALQGQRDGHMLPWVVKDNASGEIIGATRYHDIVPSVDRVEIGYTWYASRFQRTHVNTACKLLLMEYAFDQLGCGVVGLRTDIMNFRSQKAIEALGAKRDGVLRHFSPRKDGSPRDNVFFSILKIEWPPVRNHLETRLRRHGGSPKG